MRWVRFLTVQGAGDAVRRGPWNRDLAANVGETLFHKTPRLVFNLDWIAPRGMDINGRGGPAATAEHVKQGHARQFSLDVPERHVDAGDGIVQHRSAPPIGADRKHRPDVFNVMHRASDDLRLQVLLNGGGDHKRTLGEGGAAQPVEFWFISLDLDDHQPDPFRRGENHPHVANTGTPSSAAVPGWWQ